MEPLMLRVQRFNPSSDAKPRFEEFKVPLREGMTVLDAILHARDYTDHSIGVRFSCRMASCGSCGMKINGLPRLACYTPVEELNSNTVTVQPMDNFPIVKDLATDLSGFFEKHTSLLPHLVRSDAEEMDGPTSEYSMSPKELDEITQFTYCIKCGLCTSSCPTAATDSLYPGPQALAQAYRYTMDVRDEGGKERFRLMDTEHGIWRCHYAGSCSAVCPKGVDPALGIQLLKRHVMAAKAPRRKGGGAKVWKKLDDAR
ncbi:MAG: succinate dehydrogenase iron-sulfur subunit [Nitrososphaerales archaeon]|nr:succinate dehydrogenase iron-sulfur subunit [Nitrososphaerales archaeon]